MRSLLLHIGYHKTGTTWLQREGFSLLGGAARIEGRAAKAVARDVALNDEDPPIEELRDLVEESSALHPIISYELFSGAILEGAPEQKRTAGRLAEALPDAWVLIVVRAQPEMLESIHAQYINEGGTGSLSQFLAGSAPGLNWNPAHLEYDQLVSTYTELFGDDHVLVLPYELLRDRPEEFLGRVATYLDTRLVGTLTPSTINPSLSGARLEALRRWNRLARRSRFNPNPIVPVPRAARMRRLLQSSASPKRGVDPRSVAFAERYAPSNQRLGRWCDLAGSGYPGVD